MNGFVFLWMRSIRLARSCSQASTGSSLSQASNNLRLLSDLADLVTTVAVTPSWVGTGSAGEQRKEKGEKSGQHKGHEASRVACFGPSFHRRLVLPSRPVFLRYGARHPPPPCSLY